MKSEIAYFTVCNISYFPKAIVLAESLFKETGIKLQIYVADKKNDWLVKDLFTGDQKVLVLEFAVSVIRK